MGQQKFSGDLFHTIVCDTPLYEMCIRDRYGVELLLGAEINILDGKGNLDLDEDYMKMLDIRIAGIHSLCYEYGTIEENTHGMVQAISNPFIHIISHPGDGTAALHFEPMVLAAKEHHTLLEINNSSLKPTRNKPDARENNLTILRLCKKYEVPVILGSDAHISFDIARYDNLYELLQLTGFPEELIMNLSLIHILSNGCSTVTSRQNKSIQRRKLIVNYVNCLLQHPDVGAGN